MAHFAKLDENNLVTQVVVVNNQVLLDDAGVEVEQKGVDFCVNLFGGIWKQTSYNGSFRKHFAGVGYLFSDELNAFIPPKPDFPSWVLNQTSCCWEAPVPQPQDGQTYRWDEPSLSWIQSTLWPT